MDDKRAALQGNLAQRELRVSVEPIGPQALWRIKEADEPIGPRAVCQTQHTVALECDDLLLGACGRDLPENTAHMEMHCYGQRWSRLRMLAMGLSNLPLRDMLLVALLLIGHKARGDVREVPGDGR